MSHDGRIELAERSQGSRHELLRDADPEPAADQLVPDEPLPVVERPPGLENGLPLDVLGLRP